MEWWQTSPASPIPAEPRALPMLRRGYLVCLHSPRSWPFFTALRVTR
ncbi:Uncharacterised protein [Pseudomonas taetrolens]|nr:Uncharacterised protein [Pseudomonas taetrolens]